MMPQMPKKYQMSIIVSTFTLHNFIRMHELGIPVPRNEEDNEGRVDINMFDANRKRAMNALRDSIAQQIWETVRNNVQFSNEDSENDEMDEDWNKNFSMDRDWNINVYVFILF